MRRPWNTARIPQHEGSERSQQLAVALAIASDPEFLESLVHLKSLLDRVGGQVYIAAYREKYDPETGQPIKDPDKPGNFATAGYLFHYEHLAKLTKQEPEPDPKPDKAADSLVPPTGFPEQDEDLVLVPDLGPDDDDAAA